MENKLEKKYGLFTAICMVVGIVVGSGVFFKAQVILQKTGGDMPLGILAWLIGGAIMIVCILAFSAMAQKYEKVNGIVDYAEAIVGKRYGYYIGWFLSTTYYPTLTSALAWLSARYTLVFVTSVDPDFPLIVPAEAGGCIIGPECLALMLFYMVCAYAVNALSPKLAGKFQVATTVIKFIPLALMAVVGIIFGLANGMLTNNFTTPAVGYEVTAARFSPPSAPPPSPMRLDHRHLDQRRAQGFQAQPAQGSAHRRPHHRRHLYPLLHRRRRRRHQSGAVRLRARPPRSSTCSVPFSATFSTSSSPSPAWHDERPDARLLPRPLLPCRPRARGPHPELFGQVDKVSNLPNNSAILGLFYCAAWGLYFYLSNLAGTWSHAVAFVGTPFESVIFFFDPTELPIITIYALYIPIFINWMKKATDESALRRYVIPTLAICGSIFMVIACLIGHKMGNFWYLLTFAVIMLIGKRFAKNNA